MTKLHEGKGQIAIVARLFLAFVATVAVMVVLSQWLRSLAELGRYPFRLSQQVAALAGFSAESATSKWAPVFPRRAASRLTADANYTAEAIEL